MAESVKCHVDKWGLLDEGVKDVCGGDQYLQEFSCEDPTVY